MEKNLTVKRLVLAVFSTSAEETVIYAIWRWLLPEWGVNLPVPALIAIMAGWLVFSVSVFIFVTRALRRQVPAGLPSMIGTTGRAVAPLAPEGQVKIRGELWTAAAVDGTIKTGEAIAVVGQEGLRLRVKRAGQQEINNQEPGLKHTEKTKS